MIGGKSKYHHISCQKNIVLIGGGNHASYCIDIIEKEGKYNIVGIIDSIKDIGTLIEGYPVIGRQYNIKSLSEQYNFKAGLITVGDNWVRQRLYIEVCKQDPLFEFIKAIHPSVIIGNNVVIEEGVIAMAGVIFNPGSKAKAFSFFATGAQIEHDCEIGYFASVSAGSVLGGHVTVENHAAITLGVTVLDRITIGSNSVVGSGSLVTKDVPKSVVVYGSPAKIIRTRTIGERFLK